MKRLFPLLIVATSFAAAPLSAQQSDSAAFVIRLGHDTTAIERYVRTADRVIIETVTRSPVTALHRMELFVKPDGSFERAMYRSSRPGTQAPPTERMLNVAAGLVPMVGPFYTPYELTIQRGLAGTTQPAVVRLQRAGDTVDIPVARVGRDSVTLTSQFGEPMRAHVDARGRLLHLMTPNFVTVERIKWADVDRFVQDFAARDAIGKGLGALSPRSTSRMNIGGANVWLDYSRPGKRGRPVWGALVPYGQVWRMGANDAAHLAADRTLELGNLTLTPGTYTLFLEPTAAGWTLIVNKQSNISGLERDPAHDVGRIAMTMENLSEPVEWFTIAISERDGAATFSVAWDKTRGSVPLRVK